MEGGWTVVLGGFVGADFGNSHSVGYCSCGNAVLRITRRPKTVVRSVRNSGVKHTELHPWQVCLTNPPLALNLMF
jgi:hypothetical protein